MANYPVDANKTWYHGSNVELTVLSEGSTITQWKEMAEAFATKPFLLGYDTFDSPIFHDGMADGILYIIEEPLQIGVDIYQHPRTSMDRGVEWLTNRPLRLVRADTQEPERG